MFAQNIPRVNVAFPCVCPYIAGNTRASVRILTRLASFIAFDHNDHLHILYNASTGGGNPSRSRNRITPFLGCTSAGLTEATITKTRIKYLRRFILYCIRFGLETSYIFGDKQQQALIDANNEFKLLYSCTHTEIRTTSYRNPGARSTMKNGKTATRNGCPIVRAAISQT